MTLQTGPGRSEALLSMARATPGFFPIDEALALYSVARRAARSRLGPLVEIGGYLGRSTLFIAAALAAEDPGTVVFSVDHHHGSEELQAGWPDHDPSLVDPSTGRMDTLARFRRAIEQAGAEDLVVCVVADSALVAANWNGPLALAFVDGGHGEAVCWADYQGWARHVAVGGVLAFHDVFVDPTAGGRPPFDCYRDALLSGEFVEDNQAGCGSFRVLVRVRSAQRKKKRSGRPA